MEAERETEDRIRVLFMKERIGQIYDGIISHITSYGFFVELFDVFVEGLVLLSSLYDDYYAFEEEKFRLIGRKTQQGLPHRRPREGQGGNGAVLPSDTDWTGARVRSCCRLARLPDVPLVEAAKNVVPVAVTAAESVDGSELGIGQMPVGQQARDLYPNRGDAIPSRARVSGDTSELSGNAIRRQVPGDDSSARRRFCYCTGARLG